MTISLVSMFPAHLATLVDPAAPIELVIERTGGGTLSLGNWTIYYIGSAIPGGVSSGGAVVTNSVANAAWTFTETLSAGDTICTITLIPTAGWGALEDWTLADGTHGIWVSDYIGEENYELANEPYFETGEAATASYTETEVSDDAIDWYEANMPMFVSPNVAGDENNPPEWRESGSWSTGADATDSNAVIEWVTSRAYDRVADVPTRPATAETDWFLIFDLADVAFDVIAIIGHNFATSGVTEVAVEIANAQDFGAGFLELASWSSFSGARLVAVDLNGNQRYSGVQWLRVRVTGSGATAPEIGELFLGTRWQLPHRADMEADNLSLASSKLRAETEGGETQLVRRWSGRLQVALTWHPTSAAYLALFRGWFEACRWGVDPFLYIPFPNTSPHVAYLCLTDAMGQVVNVEADHYTRTVALTEQPPFVIKES